MDAVALAKQTEQDIQNMTEEDRKLFSDLLNGINAEAQIDSSKNSALPVAVYEGVVVAGAACARSPKCASTVINLFGAAVAEVILNSGEDKKETQPKGVPSTSGNSATGMPPNGDDDKENDKQGIEKTSHAQLRADPSQKSGHTIPLKIM